jgi:hypothetical protein
MIQESSGRASFFGLEERKRSAGEIWGMREEKVMRNASSLRIRLENDRDDFNTRIHNDQKTNP